MRGQILLVPEVSAEAFHGPLVMRPLPSPSDHTDSNFLPGTHYDVAFSWFWLFMSVLL